jgi:hypothetical protein
MELATKVVSKMLFDLRENGGKNYVGVSDAIILLFKF